MNYISLMGLSLLFLLTHSAQLNTVVRGAGIFSASLGNVVLVFLRDKPILSRSLSFSSSFRWAKDTTKRLNNALQGEVSVLFEVSQISRQVYQKSALLQIAYKINIGPSDDDVRKLRAIGIRCFCGISLWLHITRLRPLLIGWCSYAHIHFSFPQVILDQI